MTFDVAHRARLVVALEGVFGFLQFFVRLPESYDHPAVVGLELLRLFVVVQAIEVHFEDLVRLAQTVPRSVVPTVDFCEFKIIREIAPAGSTYGVSVALDGRVRVLHFHVLVPHQSPRRQKLRVEFERSSEVEHSFGVV